MTDYTEAGFDKFLSKGDTPNLSGSLDQENSGGSMSIPADRTQFSGTLGDVLRLGNIFLDGSSGRITIADDNGVDFFLVGKDT